jgi:hypothetical protein
MQVPARSVVIITAAPLGRPGYFQARFSARVLCAATRIPFLDGARRLLELGYEPDTIIVLRHADSDIDCLRATIGVAAKLTVRDRDRDGIRFESWNAGPAPRGSPPIAPPATAATRHRADRDGVWGRP